MGDVRHILCPVDFSEGSDRALRYAIDLASRLGAEVHLVHVFKVFSYAGLDAAVLQPPSDEELRAATQEQLDSLAAQHGSHGVKLHTHVAEGLAYRGIAEVAAETKTDLIIMGTHGRTGLSHMLLGSVAERVVRTSNLPVLTVPDAAAREGS